MAEKHNSNPEQAGKKIDVDRYHGKHYGGDEGAIAMTEDEFKTSMRAAQKFESMAAQPHESEFWSGFQRGLRRLYHGENFGTENEHILWMALADSPYESRRMKGRDYRAGFEGQSVQAATRALHRP